MIFKFIFVTFSTLTVIFLTSDFMTRILYQRINERTVGHTNPMEMKAFDVGNRKYKAIYSQFSVFVFNKYRTYAVKDRYYTMCLNQQKIC